MSQPETKDQTLMRDPPYTLRADIFTFHGNAIYLINVYFHHMFKNRQSVERFTRAILIHMNIIGQRYSMDLKLA